MDKKFLHKFTKHLILATMSKLEKEAPKKTPILIKRTIPQIQTQKLILQPINLEPTITLEKPIIQKTPKTQEKPLSLEDLAQALTKSQPQQQTPQTLSLGKLDQFISDPSIKIIECPGPNKKIKVKTVQGVKEKNITLNPGEISNIVNIFSKQANTPLTQIFKAKLQNLTITAFVSAVSGTKFIILKD